MRGAIPPLPQYVFLAWCLVKHGDSITFTFHYICSCFIALIDIKLRKWSWSTVNYNPRISVDGFREATVTLRVAGPNLDPIL
jgi:hypothetical protein